MSKRGFPSAADERRTSAPAESPEYESGYTWNFGELATGENSRSPSGVPTELQEELQRLRAQHAQLTAALEDVVAMALSGTDSKERVMLMHRRAVAALSKLQSEMTRKR